MAPDAVSTLVKEAQESGRILGVRMPVDEDETEAPWLLPPSRRRTAGPIRGALPASVNLVLADGIYVDRACLPPDLVTRLVRLAAFQNPEFYRAQGDAVPTYGKPRIISCAELAFASRRASPRMPRRSCRPAAVDSCEAVIEDRRESGTRLDVRFLGKLQPEQERAFEAVIDHDSACWRRQQLLVRRSLLLLQSQAEAAAR